MSLHIQFFAQGEPKVEWRSLPFFEGLYEVSNDGRIRRPKSIQKRGNIKPGAEIKSKVSTNGYVHVSLCRDGKESTHLVHRLVASAFLGHSSMQVNHIDGNKENNSASNLEYLDAGDNYRHAVKTGLAPLGSRNGSVTKPHRRPRGDFSPVKKLTSENVFEIRARRANGETLIVLAKEFGVQPQTILNATNGTTWAHL